MASAIALPAPPASPFPLPADAEDETAEARSRRARVEAALDGTLSGLIRAGHEAAGLPPPSPVVAPEEVPPGVHGPLGNALAPLVGAVAEAERILAPAVQRARGAFGTEPPSPAEILQDPEAYEGPLFDPAPALEAAAVVAAGIEAAIPRLVAVAATLPPGPDGAGCDVVDLVPALCVGGTGANNYREDATILVDLGGDDLHLHGAGMGNPLITGRAVGVTLDLGGNDRYLAVDQDRSGAQGFGFVGVGFLVDVGGNDTYDVLSNPRPEGGWSGSLGQGLGSLGGVGVLADLGGDDRYELRSENAASSYGTSSSGQAAGVLGGVGMLLDGGGGRDEYAARSTTRLIAGENGVAPYSGAYAFAQALAALGGASILADDGGQGSFTAESRVRPPPPGTPIGKEQSNTLPYATAQGQGWAGGFLDVGAAAFLVTGPGDTTYALRAVSDLPVDLSDEVDPGLVRFFGFSLAAAHGQGYGSVGGVAALHDLGGDDAYVIEAASVSRIESLAPQGCECPSLDARAVTWGAVAMGQGVGAFDAAGLLRDEGGNDTYALTAVAEAEAVAWDVGGLEKGAPPAAFALAGSVTAQGQGLGIVDGAGALEDAGGGNDSYTARADSRAVALVEAPGGAPASEALAGYADAQGQGAALGVQGVNVYAFGGTGILWDEGGGDSYEATASSEAVSSPDQDATDAGAVSTSAQGSVEGLSGLGLHFDGGGTDLYVTRPEDPTCAGTRGTDVWQDCGMAGLGVNLTAPSPTPTPAATPSPTPSPTPTPTPSQDAGERGSYPVVPDDPYFGVDPTGPTDFRPTQWAPRKIQAPQAWQELRATGFGIRVAVLDTGVDLQHEDLQCPGKLDVGPGSDVVNNDSDPDDQNGHGTHVAGIIGACTNNETGIAGVAPDATLVPVRVLNAAGSGTDAQLIAGLDKATELGVHVINMSLGYPPGKNIINNVSAIDAAIGRAQDAGIVVVAAAGNDSFPLCEYPALAEDIICVGATDPRDLKSWYSTFPNKTDSEDTIGPGVVAPGGTEPVFCDLHAESILSLYPVELDGCAEGLDGYRDLNGTSMAAPHVSGIAALVYDRLGGARSVANAQQVIDAIVLSASDLGTPGYDPVFGFGRVDALAAVQAIPVVEPIESPSPTPTESASPTPTETASPSPTATESPSPSPSESPAREETNVSFTDRSATSGQFSDKTFFEARLTDSNGDPIRGTELVFELTGEDSTRTFTATTKGNGVASVTPTLQERPGPHQLTVRYQGDDTHGPSADTTSFVVAKEDTALELTVQGKERTLRARLADKDKGSTRIAGRVIDFYADGELIGSATTDANGEATFEPPPSYREGKHDFEARFEGDGYYLSSSDRRGN